MQVVATPNALEFITPVTLSALTQKPVVSRFFTANTGEWHSHVDMGLWADAMVVAPATASTIAKMATGVADNILVTTYLSSRAPVFVAPAMDFDMMKHPTTRRNLQTLQGDGVRIIEAETGELASGLSGKGRMAEPQTICDYVAAFFKAAGQSPLKGKKVLITAGPTYERIDPVRFIGNFSTGKMGFALARAAADRGAEVVVVSGPTAVSANHPGVTTIRVESAREMLEACRQHFDSSDVAIFAAAVADYAPAHMENSKIKRENKETPVLELVRNPDIAATLAKQRHEGQILVGFALETDNALANAEHKLKAKGLDMVVLNTLADPGAGFGTDTNKITIVRNNLEPLSFNLKSKDMVAEDILDSLPL